MKDCVRKPIIIKLENHSNNKTMSYFVRNRFESTEDRIKRETTHLKSCKKTDNLGMLSECDDELRNDFNWLINFNLKEIWMHDIDEDEFHEQATPKKSRRRNNLFVKKNMRMTLTGILEKCLTGKEGLTIRHINKFIQERFPCMEPYKRNWKSAVRRILNRNPLFKRKKSKHARSDVWYIQSNYSNDSHRVKHNFQQTSKLEACESNSLKPTKIHPLNFPTMQPSVMNYIQQPLVDDSISYTAEMEDTSLGTIEVLNTEIWMEPVGNQSQNSAEIVSDDKSTGYYELTIPLSTDITGEPLQVHFLDDNNGTFPIELI